MLSGSPAAPRPTPSAAADGLRPKVFCVGLNKTGTSSMKFAMERLGYRVTGSNKRLLREVRRGNLRAAIDHSRGFDFFQDWPWPLIYRELHEEYGDTASFILTRRITFEKWFASLEAHARSSRLFSGQGLAYGFYRPFGREAEYRRIYETHNDAVRDYFTSGPGAGAPFVEMCLEEGDGWEKLCGFLGYDVPDEPFPHRNTAANRRRRWRGRLAVNGVIEPFYRAYARLR